MDSSSNASSTPDEIEARPAWRRVLGSTVDGMLDVVFPPTCVHCHGLVGEGGFRHLCDGCRRRIVLARAPHCTTCGYPYFGVMAENLGCAHCEALVPVFGEGRTATLLQGPMRRLVHSLKYDGALHLGYDITALVRANDHFAAFLEGAVLVPVPLHPRKLRERTFNQSEIVARCFARAVPGTVVQPLLKRVIDTGTQTRLDREARRKNLQNAFALADGAPLETATRYVLVDDVFTTGSTLNACAAVLRNAGLTRVDVATLGHG